MRTAWEARRVAACITMVAALLSACGGGGGGGGNETPAPVIATVADNYFPLDTNARWQVSVDGAATPTLSRVTGTQAVAGGTGVVVSTTDPSDGTVSSTIYLAGATGVREYAAAGADAFARAFSGIELLRLPARAGETFVQLDTNFDSGEDLDGDGRNDRLTAHSELTTVARESVSTPAGTFADSLHTRQALRITVHPSAGGPTVDVNFTIDTWYARNIGWVKVVTNVRSAAGTTSTTDLLTGYRVGSAASDSIAPTVTTRSPEQSPVRGANLSVNASFSEPMDASSITAAAFTVKDAAGGEVAGTVSLEGSTARFVALQPWVSGTYTARLSNAAQDVLGNALAAESTWTFTVDANAPGVVVATPADGAVDIGLGAPVIIDFSEAPDPASVTESTVYLNDGASRVPAQLSLAGSRLTLTPTTALRRAALYTLNVAGVTDAAGNAMAAPFSSSFRTTQGAFAYPTSLIDGFSVGAVAIGDVNSDGINDLVLTTASTQVSGGFGLHARYGQADGSLAAPVAVDIGSQLTCAALDALAIGDFNGDGRPDLAVGSNFCGTQILHQTALGALVPGEYLGTTVARVLRVADLDGDGKLELLAVGGIGGRIEIWKRDLAGVLSVRVVVPVNADVVRDVIVADIDRDGRPDLIAAVEGAPSDIAVIKQRPAGDFVTASFLTTGSPWRATALAAGDFNGDGVIEIAATTGGNAPTHVAILYQEAPGTFGPPSELSTFDGPFAIHAGDIDGDGRTDLVVSHRAFSSIGVYLQGTRRQFAPEVLYQSGPGNLSLQSLAVGDLNRDGRPDIVLQGQLILQSPPVQGASAAPTAPRARSSTALRSVVRSAIRR